MGYPELLQQIKKIDLKELRTDTADFLEFVAGTDVMDGVHAVLKMYFGAVFRHLKEKLPKQAAECVEEYGGVRDNQTLYYVERDGYSHYAMIWPWGNETCATVKLFRIPAGRKN